MKIALKKISHNSSLSEETNAFTADLYVDGKKIGVVRNQGHGGCDFFHGDQAAYDKANAWCSLNMPRSTVNGLDLGPACLEGAYNDILEDWIFQKDLKASLRSRIVFLRNGEIYASKFKGVRKIQDEHIEIFKKNGPAHDLILNELTFEEALGVYKANT